MGDTPSSFSLFGLDFDMDAKPVTAFSDIPQLTSVPNLLHQGGGETAGDYEVEDDEDDEDAIPERVSPDDARFYRWPWPDMSLLRWLFERRYLNRSFWLFLGLNRPLPESETSQLMVWWAPSGAGNAPPRYPQLYSTDPIGWEGSVWTDKVDALSPGPCYTAYRFARGVESPFLDGKPVNWPKTLRVAHSDQLREMGY